MATCLNQRIQNEDRFVVLSLERHPSWSVFAVLDGHGGDRAAQFAADHIADHLNALDEINPNGITAALQALDNDILNLRDPSGSTLALVLLQHMEGERRLQGWAAHLGDSRIILVDSMGAVLWASEDHTPDHPEERERVEAAGGFVSAEHRINGVLNLSRALGDIAFKSAPDLPSECQMISSIPHISPVIVDPGHHIILCSDGLLEADQIGNETLAMTAARPWTPEEKARDMVQAVLPMSADNLTLLLISAGVEGPTRPIEWLAGPFYPWSWDTTFRLRYLQDAARFGKTGIEVFRHALDSSVVWLMKQPVPVGLSAAMAEQLTTKSNQDRLLFYDLYLQDQTAATQATVSTRDVEVHVDDAVPGDIVNAVRNQLT